MSTHARPTSNRRVALSALAALLAPGLPARADSAPLLAVGGRAPRREFDLAAIERLPQRTLMATTPWYPSTRQFSGPLLRDLLAAAGMPADATGQARCVALNDYKVDIPLDDLRRFEVVLAHRIDGKPLSVREKGPLFVIYPFDDRPELRTSIYYGRCIWQLKAIEWV
jgi:hypothetical protein